MTTHVKSRQGGVQNTPAYQDHTSIPAFDILSVASSRPGTSDRIKVKHNVRKVQSSAFAGNKETKLQATNQAFTTQKINQNSGQLHAPKITNQMSGKTQKFNLSKEAYQKLTMNFNQPQGRAKQNSQAYATHDQRFQSSAMQQKYDAISGTLSNGGQNPGTIHIKTSDQIRPQTGAFMSTNQSSYSGNFAKRTHSVKRASRNNMMNTLQAHTSMLDSAINIGKFARQDPRFGIYNKEQIKSHLEKRRNTRRAQSTMRPRQRFNTIAAQRSEVSPSPNHRQEEVLSQRNSNRQHQYATANWSANVNLNLEQSGKKTRSYPIQGFNSGPAYSIPAQHYPERISPDKNDRTPRSPNAGYAASSRSPMRDINSQRTISPMPLSDADEATPGCTDYTPNKEKQLKNEPTYAPQRAARFFVQSKDKNGLGARPHVYEDPNARTFRRSNSGTFTRAKRFSTPIDGSQVRAYLLQLKGRQDGRGMSTGNLGVMSQQSKFTVTGTDFAKFDAASNLNVQDGRNKARPSTEVGRMRARRQTEPTLTTAVDDQTMSTLSQSNQKGRKQQNINSLNNTTPRFSANQRAGLSQTIDMDRSDILSTPGPADYETRVDSCVRGIEKQTSFTMAPRWMVKKPLVNPDAPLYDTSSKTHLLRKIQPRVPIPQAKREISPHLFHAKNSAAIIKGVYLKP